MFTTCKDYLPYSYLPYLRWVDVMDAKIQVWGRYFSTSFCRYIPTGQPLVANGFAVAY